MEPACVSACPTRALSIEAVNVEAWRADPSAGNAPNLPDVGLTLSTTRIILPDNLPADTVAASDHRIRPEHPHWPLVWLTLFTQWAAGTSAAVTLAQLTGHEARAGALVAALVGAVALVASLGHLGRPGLAWKALRNVRRSWLSREALMFALYGPLAALHALASMLGTGAAAVGVLATLVGIAGVVSSAALYVVPGRPAWHTRLTFPTFLLVAVGAGAATAVGAGALPAVALVVTAVAVLAQLGVWAANLFRLQRDGRREARGTLVLLRVRFARLAQLRVLAGVAAVGTALAGWPLPALALLLISEFVGRYLFFVTVVPLNMPGSFWREAR